MRPLKIGPAEDGTAILLRRKITLKRAELSHKLIVCRSSRGAISVDLLAEVVTPGGAILYAVPPGIYELPDGAKKTIGTPGLVFEIVDGNKLLFFRKGGDWQRSEIK